MISVLVFSLLAGAIMGLFISSIQSQRIILKDQKIISELSYVMEYMSRDLRMAARDNDGTCINSGNNYQLIGNNHIRFLSKENRCHEYLLENNRIYEIKSDDEKTGSSKVPLTSREIFVEHLYFDNAGSGWESGSGNQPKVTLNIEFRATDEDDGLILQTSVSQRNLNN